MAISDSASATSEPELLCQMSLSDVQIAESDDVYYYEMRVGLRSNSWSEELNQQVQPQVTVI